jgi:hypothetical protein
VLIVDDYGQYRGSRKAVDEYFSESGVPVLLHRWIFQAGSASSDRSRGIPFKVKEVVKEHGLAFRADSR